MTRTCSICTHAERQAIDTELVSGSPIRSIAASFHVSVSAVQRHRTTHLADILARAETTHETIVQTTADEREGGDRRHSVTVMEELRRQVDRVRMLSDACDASLRDPDDPSRYTIDPAATDISVIYTAHDKDGTPRRRRALLSQLVGQVEGGLGVAVQRIDVRRNDPAELLLKAADRLEGQMELVASIVERIHNADEVYAFQQTVMDAIDAVDPEMKERIMDSLQRHRPLLRVYGSDLQ